MTTSIAGAELRQFIERLESLEDEKSAISEQIKEVKAEAKGRGFDVTTINTILRRRKQKPDDLSEADAILDLYESALANGGDQA
jgi:uncharacterized protein (UPF0335 family)